MIRRPNLKLCGLTRRRDAEDASRLGAAYLGAILAPESPRAVSPHQAAELFAGIAGRRVGVFVNASTAEIVKAAETAGLHVLQLHGEESPSQLSELRAHGAWTIWKAVRMRDPREIPGLLDQYAAVADGLLLDTWSPAARGGTGLPFDWDSVAAYRELVPENVTLIAAGGLRADNLARAVALLRPHTVDISSGVETAPGIKDPAAIEAVMDTLRSIIPDSKPDGNR